MSTQAAQMPVGTSAVARRGLRAPVLPFAFARELTEADLPAIQSGRPNEDRTHSGLTLRECTARHHMLAMMLAAGASPARASFVTGFSVGTINSVKNNPLFLDLLSYYVDQKAEEFKDFYRKAAMVGMQAVDELGRRLSDNPDDLSNKELIMLAEKLLDRTILPSKAANMSTTPPPPPLMQIQFIEAPRRDEIESRLITTIEGKVK